MSKLKTGLREIPTNGTRVQPTIDLLRQGFKLRIGTVLGRQQKNGKLIQVRWDGRQTPEYVHMDLLEEAS